MSRKNSKQMNLNILKEIFKHEYEFKQKIKIKIRKVILYDVFSMSHMLCDQEASFDH